MWLLLSSRLRTWLLLAVAVPVAHVFLRRAGSALTARNENSRAGRALLSTDRGVQRLRRRRTT